MNKEDRKWLDQLIRENKESDEELTYTYCPFRVLYQLQQENNQLKENNQAMQEEMCRTWEKLNIIKELRTWLEEEINICDGVITTRTSDFQELGGRSAGKTFIQNEILKNKVALRSFELALNKLNELEGNND